MEKSNSISINSKKGVQSNVQKALKEYYKEYSNNPTGMAMIESFFETFSPLEQYTIFSERLRHIVPNK